MSNKLLKNEGNKSVKLISKMPEIKTPIIILLVVNFVSILGSLISMIICFSIEYDAGVIGSAIIGLINLFCVLVLKNVINWYPDGKIEYKEKEHKIEFSYYVAGLGKYCIYEIKEIDEMKIKLNTVEIKGYILWHSAQGLTKSINKYNIPITKQDKEEIIELLDSFKLYTFKNNFEKYIVEGSINNINNINGKANKDIENNTDKTSQEKNSEIININNIIDEETVEDVKKEIKKAHKESESSISVNEANAVVKEIMFRDKN